VAHYQLKKRNRESFPNSAPNPGSQGNETFLLFFPLDIGISSILTPILKSYTAAEDRAFTFALRNQFHLSSYFFFQFPCAS